MDAFSSFFSKFASPPITLSRPISTQSSPSQPPHLNISSVRIEDKPQTSTTTPRPSGTKPRTLNNQIPSLTDSSSTGAKQKAEPTVTARIFDTFDDIINNLIDPPLRPAFDPRLVLSGNFAPVN
ncbi:hypothetical protein CRYUN_Cryun07bG0196200 [Craigia yunnanensis]